MHRPPEIPARLATTDELHPPSVRSLITLAEANGWTVRTTYAKGWTAERLYTGEGPRSGTVRTPSRLVESIAVRVRRGIFGAYALWIDGKFQWAGSPYRTYSLTQLREMVSGESD